MNLLRPLVLLCILGTLGACTAQMKTIKDEIGRQKIELSVEETTTALWFLCKNATVESHRIVFPTEEQKEAIEVICK